MSTTTDPLAPKPIDTGGPAFARSGTHGSNSPPLEGMTLRDYFAAHAPPPSHMGNLRPFGFQAAHAALMSPDQRMALWEFCTQASKRGWTVTSERNPADPSVALKIHFQPPANI